MIKDLLFLLRNNSLDYTLRFILHRFSKKIQVQHTNDRLFCTLININTENIAPLIRENADINTVISYADDICKHRIDILGYGRVYIGEKYQWNRDFISEKSWNNIDSAKIVVDYSGANGDIKVPWELSRLHQLVVLGQAYVLTENGAYFDEFCNQLNDWITNNPVGIGVNWKCTMDVAIRAVNIFFAASLFQNHSGMTPEFRQRLMASLYEHMVFIRGHIEYGVSRGNHYLADVCGMALLGAAFSKLDRGRRILRYAIRRLKEEMRYQILTDGTDHEASICYHYLVTQMFLYTTIILAHYGYKFPQWYMQRLEKTLVFIADYTRSDGTAPIIGDADNAGFLKLTMSPPNRHRHLLALGASVFKNPRLKKAAGDEVGDIAWIFGPEGLKEYESLYSCAAPTHSVAYGQSGYFILRDERVNLIVHAGPIGLRGRGGHGHCDQLSFEMNVEGTDVFVDPGTYIYTGDPKMRNLFRSTAYHNTVVVDGLEQNRYDPKVLFRMQNDTRTKVTECRLGPSVDYLAARHHGYSRRAGVIHQREFTLRKDRRCLEIVDSFVGKGEHLLEWHFHLPASNPRIVLNPGRIELDYAGRVVVMTFSPTMKTEVLDGFVSKSYGSKEPAGIIKLSTKADLAQDHAFTTRIYY